MTLVLFDVDGTLLHSKGVGSAATQLAMQEVFGTVGTLAHFKFGGKTDWEMLLETLEGLYTPTDIEAKLPLYDEVLGRHMAAMVAQFEVKPCLGAPQILARCLGDPHAIVGVLTANMPSGAAVKLRAAGYDPSVFAVEVYGSEAPNRKGLPPLAIQRAEHRHNRRYQSHEVVIIGDTPEDIECAHHVGARVIAVATGRFSLHELAHYKPTVLLENLGDTELIWSHIMGAV